MALSIGTRIGSYEIIGTLGAGGMGEVYRARDTRLKRDVALKILPESFATDPDRLARFQREAEVLASLNHPNIAAIHGLEESNGTRALVMELVEGETLADRIAHGPIPVDEALAIAKQIAEALEAAHEKGIIHRDLKPANIKLRPDGTVKVLDFGLAKALEPTSAPGVDATASPTITSPAMMTGVGVLLGTAAYMSPEQARGKAVDKRSDIWAFGCVLYEMLTGRRAFSGDEVSDVLASVLAREPDWTLLPDGFSPVLVTFLKRCLHKDRKHRIGDAQSLRLALEGVFDTDAGRAGPSQIERSPPDRRPTMRRVAAASAAAVAVGGLLGGTAVWWLTRPASPRVFRTEVTTGGATALNLAGPARDIAMTPDGSRIVYRGLGQLLVRAVDQLEPVPIKGVGNPYDLFVSPDGQWIGFFDGTLLKKVAVTGGPPVTILNAGAVGRGATWVDNGTILFATAANETGLQRVSADGGSPTALTTPDPKLGEGDHVLPQLLPGGGGVLLTVTPSNGSADDAQVAVLDLRTGVKKTLIRGGSAAQYVSSGHLVYSVAGTLRAVPFDVQSLEVRGTAVPVVPQLVAKIGGSADFALAGNGTLAYVPTAVTTSTRNTLVWVDRQGREEPLAAPERAYLYPRLSPDGTRVAVAIADQQQDIWFWELTRNTLTRFTFDPGPDSYPVWTPDGRRLIFGSARGGEPNLFWQAADGSGTTERLTNSPLNQQAFSVSPDGSRVIFREGGVPYDLHMLRLGRERQSVRLFQTPFNEVNAEVSPDGRWLAFESDESGQREVHVRPFPDVGGGRWQVSTGGGSRPLWARNGEELFYLNDSGDEAALMSVRVQNSATWTASTPARLFAGRFFHVVVQGQLGQGRTYDVAPDGKRFLMIKVGGTDAAEAARIIVVQNWTEELKRLVPVN